MTVKRTKIVLIADPRIPVPPIEYGGAERIVGFLSEHLSKQGFEVVLLAGPGSRCPEKGSYIAHHSPKASWISRALRKLWFQILSARAIRGADLVINFGRTDYLWLVFRLTIPLLIVFQNPVSQSEIDSVLRRRRRNIRFVGVSRSQLQGLRPENLLTVIHNASDLPNPSIAVDRTQVTGEPYFLFLGRLTENKGVHLAIDAAIESKSRLIIAGNVSMSERGAKDYYETQVLPRVEQRQICYVGPVNDSQKKGLLESATALLFPIQWNEPCALVLPEALSCGCPVIAWRNGCVEEIIVHGKTGFVVDSVQEMITAIDRIGEIDRSTCRRNYLSSFSKERLAENYSALILEMLQARSVSTAK